MTCGHWDAWHARETAKRVVNAGHNYKEWGQNVGHTAYTCEYVMEMAGAVTKAGGRSGQVTGPGSPDTGPGYGHGAGVRPLGRCPVTGPGAGHWAGVRSLGRGTVTGPG